MTLRSVTKVSQQQGRSSSSVKRVPFQKMRCLSGATIASECDKWSVEGSSVQLGGGMRRARRTTRVSGLSGREVRGLKEEGVWLRLGETPLQLPRVARGSQPARRPAAPSRGK